MLKSSIIHIKNKTDYFAELDSNIHSHTHKLTLNEYNANGKEIQLKIKTL